MSCAAAVLGVPCLTTSQLGTRSTIIFASGSEKGFGTKCLRLFGCGYVKSKTERLSLLPRSLIVSPSKRARFEVHRRASTWGKKVWGRKRHPLVDTQGNLLAVKVTGAEVSDQKGGRGLLIPLKELLPRMKLVWGDSHYGGAFMTWLKVNLGWLMQTVKRLKVPKRGLLVPEGEEVEWEKLFPTGFHPLPRR